MEMIMMKPSLDMAKVLVFGTWKHMIKGLRARTGRNQIPYFGSRRFNTHDDVFYVF